MPQKFSAYLYCATYAKQRWKTLLPFELRASLQTLLCVTKHILQFSNFSSVFWQSYIPVKCFEEVSHIMSFVSKRNNFFLWTFSQKSLLCSSRKVTIFTLLQGITVVWNCFRAKGEKCSKLQKSDFNKKTLTEKVFCLIYNHKLKVCWESLRPFETTLILKHCKRTVRNRLFLMWKLLPFICLSQLQNRAYFKKKLTKWLFKT